MSQIKLTADSGGGTTSLKAPSSTTSNADVVLKLPVADGSSGQVLKTDGSGQLSFTSNAGTTINNNADNRIITGSGTASTLNGESSLTYDSGGMSITGDTDRDGIKITQSGNNYGEFMFNSNRSSSGNALGIIRGEWNSTEVASIYLTAGSDTTNKDDGQIRFFTSPDSGTGIQTRMLIDSSGKVGIGTSSPVRQLHVNDSAHIKHLLLDNGAGGSDVGTTPAIYSPASATLAFSGGSAERMRIDSSGNVGIGVTPTMAAGGGLHVRGPSGHQARLHMTTSNSGDTGNDGFYIIQQGAESSNNDTNFINYETANMKFSTAGTERLRVQSGGGISFNGDSAAANALDDYEEGTWTPTLNNGGSFSSASHVGKYTKIGRVVHWVCQVAGTCSGTGSGTFTISGLPFTSLNQATGGHGYAGCMGALYRWNIPNTAYQIGIRVPDNTSYIQFFANFDNVADQLLSAPFDAGNVFGSLAGTYIT